MSRPLIEQEWRAGDTLEKGFLAIAPQIYACDPFWPGEEAAVMARQFSAANPFMQQGRVWTGYIRDCARLAGFATLNAAGETVVNFGFWETINNCIPDHRLFRALMRWAKTQGASRLIGPINFSTLGKFRLRLDTPISAPFAGEPYNPPWYQHLLAQMGFQPLARYFSLFEDANTVRQLPLPEKDIGRWRAADFSLRPLTPALWLAHRQELYTLIIHHFAKSVGWTPGSEALFDWHFNVESLQPCFDAPGSCLAFGPQGDVAGLLFNLADRRQRTGIFKTIMIVPRYRRSPLYATLVRRFLFSFDAQWPRLGAALLNWKGPTTATALRACRSPHKVFHHYGLYYRDVRYELL
ncbi:hypothetical protein PU683_07065 [Kosakonia cowanii]|uniref:hypothetical protein n=1 Tax=Kosakonia cowanii TaxID=208223 RepID=UPI0023F8C6CD|nr:hypothetical protein [Kosakonia cowanii]MDF7759290.1 hypothetical protein [Kosakonia cowanii]